MSELIPIKVECHAGYKADEYPACFYWNNQRYEISEILDRWYQGDLQPGGVWSWEYPAITFQVRFSELPTEYS